MQQKVDETAFFHRSWSEFKEGFGSRDGNFWLGNDEIHRLTKDGGYKLKIDLQQKLSEKWFSVEYDKFVVGDEASNYVLQLGEFSGNISDMFSYSSGYMFSTYDRNNQPWNNPRYSNSCAIASQSGWWVRPCWYTFLNGIARYFYWIGLPGGQRYLKTSRMSLLCV